MTPRPNATGAGGTWTAAGQWKGAVTPLDPEEDASSDDYEIDELTNDVAYDVQVAAFHKTVLSDATVRVAYVLSTWREVDPAEADLGAPDATLESQLAPWSLDLDVHQVLEFVGGVAGFGASDPPPSSCNGSRRPTSTMAIMRICTPRRCTRRFRMNRAAPVRGASNASQSPPHDL